MSYDERVGKKVDFARSARRHKIGRAHAWHVIDTVEPCYSPPIEGRAGRWSWIGLDDRGVELEIIGLDFEDAVVLIHVMPTEFRRRQ